MKGNLITPSGFDKAVSEMNTPVPLPSESGPRVTRWLLMGAQVLALIAYAMGTAFLIKTTAGTLVLFSLIAPALVALAVVILVGVAIHEFRRRHGMSGFEIYDTGQIIFRQGESGDCAYFIQSGEVEVIRHENGAENIVATLSEGEYFGEKALLSSAPRSTTTRAATPTRVGIIRKRSFLAMIIVMPAGVDDIARGKRIKARTRKYAL